MRGKYIVYIIGFMGSGKTTAGKKVSDNLGWDFIDLDEKIANIEGKPVSEIFTESGEQYFREMESHVLRNLDIQNDTVISVGGGAPCSPGNMDYMKATGVVVYLKKTPGQLLSRLSSDAGKRPLLKGIKGDELLRYIRVKLSEREDFYNKADLLITGIETDIAALSDKIKNSVK